MAEESLIKPVFDERLAEKLIVLISETQEVPIEKLSLDGSLEETGLTSLNALSIVFEIENEFGVTIRDEDALQIKNIRQVVEDSPGLLAKSNQQVPTAIQN